MDYSRWVRYPHSSSLSTPPIHSLFERLWEFPLTRFSRRNPELSPIDNVIVLLEAPTTHITSSQTGGQLSTLFVIYTPSTSRHGKKKQECTAQAWKELKITNHSSSHFTTDHRAAHSSGFFSFRHRPNVGRYVTRSYPIASFSRWAACAW